MKATAGSYPSPGELAWLEGAELAAFPVPKVSRPIASTSRSSRLRHRHKRKLLICSMANRFVAAVNGLSSGKSQQQTDGRRLTDGSPQLQSVWLQVHAYALRRSCDLAKARRGLGPTGVHPTAALLKRAGEDIYSLRSGKLLPQVPLVADTLDSTSPQTTSPSTCSTRCRLARPRTTPTNPT